MSWEITAILLMGLFMMAGVGFLVGRHIEAEEMGEELDNLYHLNHELKDETEQQALLIDQIESDLQVEKTRNIEKIELNKLAPQLDDVIKELLDQEMNVTNYSASITSKLMKHGEVELYAYGRELNRKAIKRILGNAGALGLSYTISHHPTDPEATYSIKLILGGMK